MFESLCMVEHIRQHTSEFTRSKPLTLEARNYISATKIWPIYDLKFELNCECYSLLLHIEEKCEK